MPTDAVRLLAMWPSRRPTPSAHIESAETAAVFPMAVPEMMWTREIIHHGGTDLDLEHLSAGGAMDRGGMPPPGTYLRVAEAPDGDACGFTEILRCDGKRETDHPLRASSNDEAKRLLELWAFVRGQGRELSRFRKPADAVHPIGCHPQGPRPAGTLDGSAMPARYRQRP
jgi:hypothetical protein